MKPSPEQALTMLREGNARFAKGQSEHPRQGAARLKQAGSEDQGGHAYATVLTCSDSRVPVELIFDAGIMDIFVIRVAGNVVNTDEAGSIEYGLLHVNTPVLVVLGHTQCGAVTAVAKQAMGRGSPMEKNIIPLVAPIGPAVKAAMAKHPGAGVEKIIAHAIEANVWQAIADLFKKSPDVRKAVEAGKHKVVGAIYDVTTGKIDWLPQEKVSRILAEAKSD